jgi:hypothetical protein
MKAFDIGQALREHFGDDFRRHGGRGGLTIHLAEARRVSKR